MSIPVPAERIEQTIFVIHGRNMMLDSDLTQLYGVTVGRLNEAVKRSEDRFPSDFMFQLTKQEFEHLKSQFAISRSKWGGRRHTPYAFIEQGVTMLSSLLRSRRASLCDRKQRKLRGRENSIFPASVFSSCSRFRMESSSLHAGPLVRFTKVLRVSLTEL